MKKAVCFQTCNTKMLRIKFYSFHVNMEGLNWSHWIVKGL